MDLDFDTTTLCFTLFLSSAIFIGFRHFNNDDPKKKKPLQTLTRSNQRGHFYYEMLEFAPLVGGLRFYNTVGIQKSPEEEQERIKTFQNYKPPKRYIKNGPRIWLSDEVGGYPSGRKTFGGIEMLERATLRIPLKYLTSLINIWDKEPSFITIPMRRHTVYIFWEGRYVHLLLAPDGSVYIMQSASIEIDKELREETLHEQLPKKLKLPSGWRFMSIILPQRITLRTSEKGEATLIRDHLKNSYQKDAEHVLTPILQKYFAERSPLSSSSASDGSVSGSTVSSSQSDSSQS